MCILATATGRPPGAAPFESRGGRHGLRLVAGQLQDESAGIATDGVSELVDGHGRFAAGQLELDHGANLP
jgi:hypothetical protein